MHDFTDTSFCKQRLHCPPETASSYSADIPCVFVRDVTFFHEKKRAAEFSFNSTRIVNFIHLHNWSDTGKMLLNEYHNSIYKWEAFVSWNCIQLRRIYYWYNLHINSYFNISETIDSPNFEIYHSQRIQVAQHFSVHFYLNFYVFFFIMAAF